MTKSILLDITDPEKELLLESVDHLTGKFEELVERFYHYFLQSDEQIKEMFKRTHMERQQSMFNVAIGVIVTNIDNPELLFTHINQVIDRHRLYGVKDDQVHFFTSSMSKAIKDVFGESDPIVPIWLKLINDVMQYFRTNI